MGVGSGAGNEPAEEILREEGIDPKIKQGGVKPTLKNLEEGLLRIAGDLKSPRQRAALKALEDLGHIQEQLQELNSELRAADAAMAAKNKSKGGTDDALLFLSPGAS